MKAATAAAFDRDTGESVPAALLRIYAEALSQYHLSPEAKLLNAGYLDRGTTIRRHVYMTAARYIGKESQDWERQAVLGLSRESEVAYGVSVDDLAERLRAFIADLGESKVAKALGISAR